MNNYYQLAERDLVRLPTSHTDNGTEVTSQEVVKMLKKINPSIVTVTEWVRQPSDQGSIENIQQHVKVVIRHCETEARQCGE